MQQYLLGLCFLNNSLEILLLYDFRPDVNREFAFLWTIRGELFLVDLNDLFADLLLAAFDKVFFCFVDVNKRFDIHLEYYKPSIEHQRITVRLFESCN